MRIGCILSTGNYNINWPDNINLRQGKVYHKYSNIHTSNRVMLHKDIQPLFTLKRKRNIDHTIFMC